MARHPSPSFLLPLSRSRSVAEWVYPVSLLPQGSNFLRLPHPPSPSPVVVCSQLIPHNKRKPGLGRRHRSRMGAHVCVRAYVQEHAWRRSCLAFSLNGPRLLSPVYHHGRPRTPSAANLSLPSPANPQRRTSLSSYEACTILWD